ncbi:cell division ATP-binding protein FtsE [Desulfothermus okinawensis]
MAGANPIIEVTNLYHYFGKRKILEKINLKIPKGSFVFLTGQTGSGKSTFLKILHGEISPTAGIVRIDDFIISPKKKPPIHLLRRHVQMVYQDFEILEDYTVVENIEIPLRSMGLCKKRRQKRLSILLKILELEPLSTTPTVFLSGGEKQRVAIARAISTNPKILLADEPTGNLDPNHAEKIMKILCHFNKHGTTIILATHSNGLQKLIPKSRKLIISGGAIKEQT